MNNKEIIIIITRQFPLDLFHKSNADIATQSLLLKKKRRNMN